MSSPINTDAILTTMLQAGGDAVSDLLFVVGRLPQMEVYGKLKGVEIPGVGVLTPAMTSAIADQLVGQNDRLRSDLEHNGSCDNSYALSDVARFRVNVYRQNGNLGIVMRRLPTQIPTIEGLRLPPIFKQIIKEKTGLVFVTGATGSGKTTTLAAMLNEFNNTEDAHVVTLEDPIEFLHPHKRCTFSQRELGKDFVDFASGLRAALRQAPKVIFVGEIRDRETMDIALTAAETGHIVYATLHTISAAMTVNRVIGFYENDEEQQIRQRLAGLLRYTVSQRLVQKLGGGRQLISEIMGNSLRTREAIQLGESDVRNLHEIISVGVTMGWHTFEQCLLAAFKEGKISEETAMLNSNHKNIMSRELDIAKKAMAVAEEQSDTGLRLDKISLSGGH